MNPLEVRMMIHSFLVKKLKDPNVPVISTLMGPPRPRKPLEVEISTVDPLGEPRNYVITIREVD